MNLPGLYPRTFRVPSWGEFRTLRESKKRFVRETIQGKLDQLVADQTDGSGEVTAERRKGTRKAVVRFIIRDEVSGKGFLWDQNVYIVELLSVVVEGFWETY